MQFASIRNQVFTSQVRSLSKRDYSSAHKNARRPGLLQIYHSDSRGKITAMTFCPKNEPMSGTEQEEQQIKEEHEDVDDREQSIEETEQQTSFEPNHFLIQSTEMIIKSENTSASDEAGRNSHEEESEQDIFAVNETLTKSGKKRKRKKYNKTKTERQEYLKSKRIQSHYVKPPCKCKKNCMQHFTENLRTEINTEYWENDYVGRKLFVANAVEQLPVMRRRPGTVGFKKKVSQKYFLQDPNGGLVNVCKAFFLATLGYAPNNDSVLKNIDSSPKERRGSYMRPKLDREVLKRHIKTFTSCSSREQKHVPKRILQSASDIKITEMYKDFRQKHPHVTTSYDLYRQIVNHVNNSKLDSK